MTPALAWRSRPGSVDMPPTPIYVSAPHRPRALAEQEALRAARETTQRPNPAAPTTADPAPTVRTTRIKPRSTKLHPSDVVAMTATYLAGTSVNQLATRHGVTPATAVRALRAANIDTSPKRISDARADRICRLYESGLSVLAITRELGMPKSSILNVLRRRDVVMRSELRGGAR